MYKNEQRDFPKLRNIKLVHAELQILLSLSDISDISEIHLFEFKVSL